MLYLAHKLIVGIYLAAPVAALALDFRRAWRKGAAAPSAGLLMTICAAVLVGTGIAMLYVIAVGGKARIGQILLAVYFAAGLLLILKVFDYSVRASLEWFIKRKLAKAKAGWRSAALGLVFTIRVCLLIALGLPYVMAAVMTYRPKVGIADNPTSQLGFAYEDVSFRSSDGLRISGWWIPAIEPTRRLRRADDFGQKTVIVCHGLGASKSNQLIMARPFVPAGYNVLIFDFRAHGQSDGQLSSFGDNERRDVLAAVRWLRENRPGQSKEIFGVGASMGGAALIAAAADPSEEGQSIKAVAVFDTYDSLREEFHAVARDRFPQPLRWPIERFGMQMASLQVGANLSAFAPADLVQQLWPRPILVIHGTRDPIIGFDRGQQLFNAACQPKERLWIDGADHNSIINDDEAARRVREFFDSAQAVPVI